MTDTGKCPAFGCDCEYVAKFEAQAAEIERLRGIVSVWLDLAIGPDEMGDYHRQKWAIKASQEALGETLHVPETCKENGETFT